MPPPSHMQHQVWDPHLKQWLDVCGQCGPEPDEDEQRRYERANQVWGEAGNGEL